MGHLITKTDVSNKSESPGQRYQKEGKDTPPTEEDDKNGKH